MSKQKEIDMDSNIGAKFLKPTIECENESETEVGFDMANSLVSQNTGTDARGVKPSSKTLPTFEFNLKNVFSKNGILILSLGQLLSLFITTTGVTSNLLSLKGISVPTTQSFLNYFLLALVYGIRHFLSRKPLKMPLLSYCWLAIVDVESNYLVVSAYQYTTMTSIALLDCWAIPCTILLSYLLFRVKYKKSHFVGVLICMVGLSIVVTSDAYSDESTNNVNTMVYGDILVIIGATLYAFANITEEYVVKHVDKSELLFMLGFFGSIISIIQLFIFERNAIKNVQWDYDVIISFLIYAVALFSFYSLAPLMLNLSGSTMFNLSLLTADIWIVLMQKLLFLQNVSWLFYIAYVFICLGLLIYSSKGMPASEEQSSLIEAAEDESERKSLVQT